MNNLSKKYIDRLYNLYHDDIPQTVTEKSKECFKDYLAVTVCGSCIYRNRNELYIKKNILKGPIHIIGMKQTSDVRTAVTINAFNAHFLELDDSHRSAMTHLGAPIFSALLGAAELYRKTLNDVLCAATVGYEAAIRLANSIQPSHKKRGFHVSGTCCTIGSAMAIAAMLGYSKEQMNNVLCAACTSAAGLLGATSDGSEQKPYNIANAASAGLNAALYGVLFKGANDILGDSRGFMRAMSDEQKPERLFESGYAIESIYQKLYAACRHCHAPLEAMLKIRKKQTFQISDVTRIEVQTYDLAIKGHDHTEISGISSAKQSIPYGVAAACLYQDCGMSAFTEEKLHDAVLHDLIQKTQVIENEELTSLVPGKRAAVVKVYLKDGTSYTERVDYAKGEPENPISKEEFTEKYYSLTDSAGMTRQNADAILYFIDHSENETVTNLFQWI